MERKQDIKIKVEYVLGAIVVNCIILALIMLFFEPTAKSDDYDMNNILCGGVNGSFGYFLLYQNVLLGYFLKALITVWPTVPWYYIVQYFLLLVSFVAIQYVLCMRHGWKKALGLHVYLMFFCSYEFYIRITFSKTAGVLIVAGLLLVLCGISQHKYTMNCICGGCLIFCGMLYRLSVFKLVICIFFATFIFHIIDSFKNRNKSLKRDVCCFVIVVILGLFLCAGLEHIQNKAFNKDEVWVEYREYNTARAILMDYGWPDYDTYEEQYQSLGVSKNDYIVWKNYADFADPDVFSSDMIRNIQSIIGTPSEKEIDFKVLLLTAFKSFGDYLIMNPVFWLFWMIALLSVACSKEIRRTVFQIGIVIGLCYATYIYMLYLNRIQHHIDAVIYLAATVILSFEFDGKLTKKKSVLLLIVLISAISYFYPQLVSSSYYGTTQGFVKSQKELYSENYEKMSLLSSDSEHLYLLEAMDSSYYCFSTFQNIERGFYHNIFKMNQYTVPVFRAPLENYGVDNPFESMVNNPLVYYCVPKEMKSRVDQIQEYIKEHYSEDVYYTLIKDIEGLYVYCFNEGDLKIDETNIQVGTEKIECEINVETNDDGHTKISGYAFERDTDSYAQNVYIEIVDTASGEKRYYHTLQSENDIYRKENKYLGKYSAFSINIDDVNISECEKFIILENSKGIYKLPIIEECIDTGGLDETE